MKRLIVLTSSLFTLWTAAQPIWAEDTSTVRTTGPEEVAEPRLSDLGMHLNPQIGLSNFEYSGNRGGGQQKLSGGATVEFGEGARKLETGLLLMQTSANAVLNDGSTARIGATYLTLPMMAKLRLISMKSQSWYAKVGFTTAFALSNSNAATTNSIDVLGGLGIGGRFVFTKQADFIIEATYNRGFMDAVSTSAGTNYNQGFLILAGVSFRI